MEQSRAKQVAQEIVWFTQNKGTMESVKFAIEEIEKYFVLKPTHPINVKSVELTESQIEYLQEILAMFIDASYVKPMARAKIRMILKKLGEAE